MNDFKELFRWNGQLSSLGKTLLIVFYILAFFGLWSFACPSGIPKPDRVWAAWQDAVANQNLIGELMNSMQTCLIAMCITIFLTLFLAYISRIPFFSPIIEILTRFRFLSLIGLSFIFLLFTTTSYQAKIATMSFSILTYLLTGLVAVIRDIPQKMYNYSRTLRMSEAEVTWYTVVRGTFYEAVDLMAQNFAIAWMMLTSIECMFREYGGIGALLMNDYQKRGMEYALGIQITILIVGLLMDSLLRGLIYIAFPYRRKPTNNFLLKWITGQM
jgi:ABC-type nitrate/sulfonate/bicarbonate transport system permease component